FRDLQSSNGLFLDGRRVESGAIERRTTLILGGADGPRLTLEPETGGVPSGRETVPAGKPAAHVNETRVIARVADRYCGPLGADEAAGPQTRMIRKAFEKVQQRQRRRHGWTIAAIGLLAAIAAGYAYYGHRQILKQEAIAEELFYSMKALDVEVANVER